MRTAKHLALQHLQTVDVAFDGAIAPGQRHPSFDGGIVVAQSLRKTLQGLHRTGRGAGEPAIEALRLAGPHEVGKVPGQRDRLRELLWSAKIASRLWTGSFPPARIGGDAHLYSRRMPWR